MDKKLLEYFKSLNLTPGDVENILEVEPELKTADAERVIENSELVIKLGFPRVDMGSLIQVNPSFLLLGLAHLKEILLSLDDVEEELKNNPFLI